MTQDGWPAIKEIDPFVTWTVTTVQEMYESDKEHFVTIERQSREELIRAFEAVGDRMYGLDLNHYGYSFVPGTVARLGIWNLQSPARPSVWTPNRPSICRSYACFTS